MVNIHVKLFKFGPVVVLRKSLRTTEITNPLGSGELNMAYIGKQAISFSVENKDVHNISVLLACYVKYIFYNYSSFRSHSRNSLDFFVTE